MALDIIAQDLIIDETAGLDADADDVNPNVAPHNNATVNYLLTLDAAGGLSSPEVAFQQNFVVASANAGEVISGVTLTQSIGGTAFSKTDGVNSGLQTVDGNYVWLFQSSDPSHPNVIIGVIGTSDINAEPSESGPLAFSFALVGTSATNYDLYTVQYVPLLHGDATDPDDRIDLAGKVFASVSGSTTVGFNGANAPPGINDFYCLSSPDDASKQVLVTGFVGTTNSTPNVSTQGFGVKEQSIDPNDVLQVDFVTGGTLSGGSASQINYVNHIETITSAGFTINQITPSTPSKRVDIKITAYNVTGNEQGLNFYDGSPTTPVDITSIKLTGTSGFASTITADGTYATGSGNVVVSGLSGTGNAVTITGLDNVTVVDFTTATPMDRLTVTGVDANEGCDITEFHYQTTTPNSYTEQVGSFINFDDDGPGVQITAAPVVGACEVVEASGVAGKSTATITPPTYTTSGADGVTPTVSYALALIGGAATGLQTTVGNKAITLVADSASQISGKYDSDNNGSLDATAFTVSLSGTTVTLTSLVALEHSNSPQGAGEDNTLDLDGLIKVVATVSVVDGDGDPGSAQSSSTGLSLTFDDTDPTLQITVAPVVGAAEVVEASGIAGQSQATITAPTFTSSAVDTKVDSVSYALTLLAGTATGLLTTAGNNAITLVADSATQISGKYDSDNNGSLDATAFTVSLSGTTVTLRSLVALEHPNAQGLGEVNTLNLNGLIGVRSTVTVTDGDNDSVSAQSTSGALSLVFDDTDPSLSITAAPVVGAAEVVEASGVAGKSTATITAPTYNASAVDGYTPSVSYELVLAGAAATGLQTTAGNYPISLVLDSASQISGKYDSDNNGSLDATAFTVSLSGTTVTLTSLVALEHSNSPQGVGEDNTLDLNGLINVRATVTVTDGDNDAVSSQTSSTGLSLTFDDTDPTLTKAFDADPNTLGDQSPEHLLNTLNATASGNFGYAMTDQILAADYNVTTGVSDFVDASNAAGVQISLTGTVDNQQNPNITNAVATLTSEDLNSATFNFSFHYDKDPITAGVQDSLAAGTLVFDKVNDTYTFTLTDVIDGFSFDVLHTNELIAKQPTGNTGHPLIVAEQLTANNDPDPFFVQFTANSVTNSIGFGFSSDGQAPAVGDTTFNNQGATHDMVTNSHEDWVSATQSTNGVAGDTIQKGELLTLRFFKENILGDVAAKNERTVDTAATSGVVLKFDGIGSSEDLVLILSLTDGTNHITRAINVQNGDLIKGNANIPAPYNTEFTLDNNDALLIIEQNDYSDGSEHYKIEGIQIMQSSNGLIGTAIDLNGAIGDAGDSSATSGLTAWDPTDNDVLKIVDIGFVQQTSGTIGANLDFAFNITDGDGDLLSLQHINVQVADSFV